MSLRISLCSLKWHPLPLDQHQLVVVSEDQHRGEPALVLVSVLLAEAGLPNVPLCCRQHVGADLTPLVDRK